MVNISVKSIVAGLVEFKFPLLAKTDNTFLDFVGGRSAACKGSGGIHRLKTVS